MCESPEACVLFLLSLSYFFVCYLCSVETCTYYTVYGLEAICFPWPILFVMCMSKLTNVLCSSVFICLMLFVTELLDLILQLSGRMWCVQSIVCILSCPYIYTFICLTIKYYYYYYWNVKSSLFYVGRFYVGRLYSNSPKKLLRKFEYSMADRG